jgi:hypothetical protein
MRRFFAVAMLSSLTGLCGCLNIQDREERDPWSKSQWQEEFRADQRRLKSEDELRTKKWTDPIEKVTDKIWDQITRIYNYITGDTPFQVAKNLLDPTYPDRRRQAVMWFSKREYGRKDPYVIYYAEMARTDTDWSVRAMAIRALNRVRARQYSSIYIEAMTDKNELVRLEAVKALANMPDPRAVDELMNRLDYRKEESVDVRIAAADALRHYRTSQVAHALVRALGSVQGPDPLEGERQLGVSFQARRSLKLMTGKDYRYDVAKWLDYLATTPKPFVT